MINHIRQILLSSLIALNFCVSCSSKQANEINRKIKPNVILIMIDDQGYGDIAAHGNKWIETPNIDALHSVSTRLTDYHVSPTCAPTRAALMTGHHNLRTGVFFTILGRSLILERETTMAQAFKANGYSTGIFGKWHLGDNYPFRPQDKGFDEVLIHNGGGVGQTMDYWNNDYFDDTYMHNGKLEKFEGYCADVWFENAKNYIESKKDEPFFCYLSTNTAHSPYWVEDKYYEQYKDNEKIAHKPFYGMITNIDENIGKLTSYLESSGLMDDTIIIFTSDNGSAQGAKIDKTVNNWDGNVVKGFNAGMRGIKASMYEGGHRVPFFIHWPNGGLNTGKDVGQLTAHYDVFPTLVDLCNLKIDPFIKFDGQSLVPLMDGKTEDFEDRIVFVNTQFSAVQVPWKRTAVLHQNWRLIEGEKLYDLKTDPGQWTNVADQFPKKVEQYKAAYDKWWEEISPSFEEKPYFIVGNEAENPTTLFCHDWHTDEFTPWAQRHIRSGYINNGFWRVKVDKAGTYNFKLRRWPKESGLALNAEAPIRPALEGTSMDASKKGKALNIEKARIEIQEQEVAQTLDDAAVEYVEFNLELKKGKSHLQTWFTLDDGTEIGAYYAEIKKL